ncbi:MAG: hypothetical protein A2622_04410 [Bdellovibrionales bacterium RIFCSPHIGHO2_01_FULL_40_29]|nr:MAG: hypothetical protein A2622_04410 [Bdellovibrionales bacterium RIFCSPHIGHO2_01_FULL_40_29]OFZ34820.1 MAG: hypothetical protein A3D17_10965 [Bdellovibrionales bacterium RIFCSPHIGHO2_02_FULL_40_15]
MKNLNVKTILLSTTVLMALSGCGKSKELNTPEAAKPVAPVEQQQPVNVTTEEAKKEVPDVNNNPGNDLMPGGTESADSKTEDKNPVAANTESKDKKITERQAHEIDFSNQEALKTGGTSKDLFYTGAGRDGVLEEFKAYATTVSKEQQQMNSNLARAVVGARLLQLESGDAQIDLVIDETINGVGGLKSYRLKGSAEGSMIKLSGAGSNGDLEFQGGFLKCIDADGGCLTSYAKIKFSGAYTRIIFRNSFANMHFITQAGVTNNYGFDVLKTYINNSSTGVVTNQKIDGLELASFEVVNGRSSMGAMLTTMDDEMLGLSIPLVVSNKGTAVNATVSKSLDLSKSYGLPSGLKFSQKLASGITDVKLLNNNGRGDLKLKLSIGSNAGVWMVISPIQKSVMSLEAIREFDKNTKKF